jgi:hypothetical protein
MNLLPLLMPYDFIQVLHSVSKLYTKNSYFCNHNLFPTNSLLKKQILNPRNYSKQELTIELFMWATNNDINIYTKIQIISKLRYF